MGVLDKFLNAIKLNDDFDEEDYEEEFEDDEDYTEDEEELKPRKKFFDKFKRRDPDDEEDEDLYDSEPTRRTQRTAAATAQTPPVSSRPPKQTSSKITPMRNAKRNSATPMEVCVIKPVSMEDTREIADTLVDNCTVVLNLEGVDVELAQRIIDFTSGSCYSLGGSLQKISSYIFIITPHNVDVSGDFQSILGDSVPSIRSEY